MYIEVIKKRIFYYWRVMEGQELILESPLYVSRAEARNAAMKLGMAFGVKVEIK